MIPRLKSRLARAALRWYPAEWRRRYAHEMRALLDESPAGWRQILDLAVESICEWVSPTSRTWPTASTFGRAQGAFLLLCSAAAVTITWSSHVIGGWLSATGIELPRYADMLSSLLWLALAIWVNCGSITNSVRLIVSSMKGRPASMPVMMLGPIGLLGLALAAFVAGVAEGVEAGATPRFWLADLMPYFRAFSFGIMGCSQSARMTRLGRAYSRAAIREHRHDLGKHEGPRLGLDDGPVGGASA